MSWSELDPGTPSLEEPSEPDITSLHSDTEAEKQPENGNLTSDNSETTMLHGRGPLVVASELQCALLKMAFAALGLCGPTPVSTWCHALGRIGISSVEAREFFEVLDVEQTGRVSPAVFCNADLAQEAFSNEIRASVELVQLLQLRYRLLLLGSRVHLGLRETEVLDPEAIAIVCRRLGIGVGEADAAALLKMLFDRGNLCPVHSTVEHIELGTLCHQLAIFSTSASKLNRHALLPEPLRPLQPFHDVRGWAGPNAPPAAYAGKTPIEIIVRFKDPATFPWHRLPEAACGRRFEELWRLARQTQQRIAEETVQLLTDPMYDRVKPSTRASGTALSKQP